MDSVGMAFVGGSALGAGKSQQVSRGVSKRESTRWRMSEVSPTAARVEVGPLKISPLGVGAWSWGDEFYWGKGSERDQKEAFFASVDAGVNFFDTAEVYALGESERRCGRFVKSYEKDSDANEEIIVATKFAPLVPFRFNANSVVDACKKSAERLGVDTIDLYQLHFPGAFVDKAYWDGIAKCYNMGLIKAVGVSNYGPKRLQAVHRMLTRERGVPIATNQVLYNLVYRKPEEELMELCESLDIKILAYSPLAQGVLTGKYETTAPPRGPRGATVRSMLSQTENLRRVLREISESRDRTVAQIALNWLLMKGVIPIPGAKNRKQAEQNAGALGWQLSDEEMERLDDVSSLVGDVMPAMPVYTEVFVPN
mmetsp:Transcript_407/g.1389  ORF Transcript_407/g.1389 Transcript_407/m.1389 type:complete len:368 (+) Transcript_407:138-1241(+)